MSNSKVALVIRVGDDELSLGTCNPAQARVLVKKEAASWQDGKLLIIAKPAFLQMMENGNHWTLDKERKDVSSSELMRRREWFQDFMTRAVKAIITTSREPRHMPVSPAVPKNWQEVKKRAQECKEWAEAKELEVENIAPAGDLLESLTLVEHQVDLMLDAHPDVVGEPLPDFPSELWETAPEIDNAQCCITHPRVPLYKEGGEEEEVSAKLSKILVEMRDAAYVDGEDAPTRISRVLLGMEPRTYTDGSTRLSFLDTGPEKPASPDAQVLSVIMKPEQATLPLHGGHAGDPGPAKDYDKNDLPYGMTEDEDAQLNEAWRLTLPINMKAESSFVPGMAASYTRHVRVRVVPEDMKPIEELGVGLWGDTDWSIMDAFKTQKNGFSYEAGRNKDHAECQDEILSEIMSQPGRTPRKTTPTVSEYETVMKTRMKD